MPKYTPAIDLIQIMSIAAVSMTITLRYTSKFLGNEKSKIVIIGSGLYVDNEIGGAVATGMGEEIVKTVGSFLIVELMRQGYSPQDACDEAIQRIIRKQGEHVDFQVAYIALDKKGRVGSSSIHKGFTYMKYQNGENKNIEVNNFINS